MSIDYKIIYEGIKDLHQDLIFELGRCYVNNRPFEKTLIKFLQSLDLIIYPNNVFLEAGIPFKEFKYEETK